ncbi:MAG: hypothetical protein C4325_10230 [Blastocatellia bacterium]
MKQTLQEAIEAELEEFLGYPRYKRTDLTNSRNGYSQKEVVTDSGEVEISVPGDMDSKFEPKVVRGNDRVY